MECTSNQHEIKNDLFDFLHFFLDGLNPTVWATECCNICLGSSICEYLPCSYQISGGFVLHVILPLCLTALLPPRLGFIWCKPGLTDQKRNEFKMILINSPTPYFCIRKLNLSLLYLQTYLTLFSGSERFVNSDYSATHICPKVTRICLNHSCCSGY